MQAAPTAVGGPLVHRGNTDGGAILHDDRGQKYLFLQTLDTGCGAQGPLDEDDDGDDDDEGDGEYRNPYYFTTTTAEDAHVGGASDYREINDDTDWVNESYRSGGDDRFID
mmetsp:Transcript_7362/g.20697  ORF Transcript_7362/g.20697 Transcript_7362/m.20697 type:complete len:111 (-) Transcript_7362:126-458(-)